MKCSIILLATLGLFLCALSAGCSSQEEVKPAETTVPTTLPTTSAPTVVSTLVALETLPSDQYVDIQIEKQRPDATIHLLYNGGKGEMFVQNIMIKVTLSNGQVVQQYMNDGNRKPRRGDELVIEGTRGTDLVQVYLTSAGRTYKVREESLILSYL